MRREQETSQIAEEIANEVYRLVTNKFKVVEELKGQMEKIEKQLKNFSISLMEMGRVVSQKNEESMEQTDKSLLSLIDDVQELRNEISGLKIEIKNLKEKRL